MSAVACSDPSFETAAPAGDDAGVDTAIVDARPDSVDARDAEDAGDAADPGDATDGDATCAPNACGGCAALDGEPGETCGTCGGGTWKCDGTDATKCEGAKPTNACGGCAALSASPGGACGDCGDGKWACDGVDALKCEGAKPTNACGGCATLGAAPGTSCGACGGGAYACSGKEATVCADPVTHAPGSACGTCGTSKYVCAADGKSTVCSKADDRNACGGCTSLPTLGTACGKCGSGKWICNGTDAVKCDDPVPAASPAPGTACGTCKTKAYTCTADKKNTTCAGPDDLNACGGCGTLAGAPGAACGTCGKWACAGDKASVSCGEASPTAGSACGICGKSTYACTGLATTTCSKPDDRLPYLDVNVDAPRTPSEVASRKATLGFSYVGTRGGELTKVRLRLIRSPYQCGFVATPPHPDPACTSCIKFPPGASTYTCSVADAAKVASAVKLSIYEGLPSSGVTLRATVILASDELTAVAGVEGWVDFVPAAPVPITAGKPLFFELSTDSTMYQFHWDDAGPAAPGSSFKSWRKALGATTWESDSRVRGIKVDILSCADS